MTDTAPLNGYWLPTIADWPQRINEIERMAPSNEAWDTLVHLAGHRLNFLRSGRLDQALLRLFGDAPPPGLTTKPVRLGLLASSTTTQLLPGIRAAALRRGFWVTIHEVDYGQYRQALEDPTSSLHAFAPTAILFALDARHLLAGANLAFSREQASAELERVATDLRQLWGMAAAAFRCQVMQQTVLPLFDPLMGSNEAELFGAPLTMAAGLNARLREAAGAHGVNILALDQQVARDGLAAWHDVGLWHRAKQEISPRAALGYGELVTRLLAAAQGRSAKCLVLDLDNTLWGGVIGDDGLDGIVIGQGSATGEAFAAFQSYAAALGRRGIILAACSKNDESNALEAFDRHPEMVLRRKDIAAFAANWNDKPANIRAIAQTLNIGLDALVFVDDNPFEREHVRRELPMVAVPEMPEDPALFPACIADAGYFEALAITEDDRARSLQYATNRDRQSLQAGASDVTAFLRSLDMQLSWRPFDAIGLKRIAQLINKTNQFNLTTRRYAEEQVATMMADPNMFGLQFRLADRLGDNGMVAVVIGRLNQDGDVELDSWLMSCRVLGRRVEEAMLQVVAGEAARRGARRIFGRYIPTAKNGMVADLYSRLGFTLIGSTSSEADYAIEPDAVKVSDLPIVIVEP